MRKFRLLLCVAISACTPRNSTEVISKGGGLVDLAAFLPEGNAAFVRKLSRDSVRYVRIHGDAEALMLVGPRGRKGLAPLALPAIATTETQPVSVSDEPLVVSGSRRSQPLPLESEGGREEIFHKTDKRGSRTVVRIGRQVIKDEVFAEDKVTSLTAGKHSERMPLSDIRELLAGRVKNFFDIPLHPNLIPVESVEFTYTGGSVGQLKQRTIMAFSDSSELPLTNFDEKAQAWVDGIGAMWNVGIIHGDVAPRNLFGRKIGDFDIVYRRAAQESQDAFTESSVDDMPLETRFQRNLAHSLRKTLVAAPFPPSVEDQAAVEAVLEDIAEGRDMRTWAQYRAGAAPREAAGIE